MKIEMFDVVLTPELHEKYLKEFFDEDYRGFLSTQSFRDAVAGGKQTISLGKRAYERLFA